MAVTVQMQFESAVTEMYQDAFVGSSIENGATIITFDLRQRDVHHELEAPSTLSWRKEAYHVDVHELSTFHNPIKYRFILAQGYYLDDQNQRRDFTPEIKGVSTAQHMSHSSIRLACYLAVVCGVSLRHIALIFAALFLIPITKSSIKRWIDDIGSNLPCQEKMLQQLLASTPATECHIDGGSYWIPGSYVTSNSMSACSNALPRCLMLCTNSKRLILDSRVVDVRIVYTGAVPCPKP